MSESLRLRYISSSRQLSRINYGPSATDAYRQAASTSAGYSRVSRMAICRSSRRKFELVINQMTGNKLANHLGVRSSPAPTRRSTTAMGHKPTRKPVGVMSALPLQADLQRAPRQVRFVPESDVGCVQSRLPVGIQESSIDARRWNRDDTAFHVN
jgi:hypothetical protein